MEVVKLSLWLCTVAQYKKRLYGTILSNINIYLTIIQTIKEKYKNIFEYENRKYLIHRKVELVKFCPFNIFYKTIEIQNFVIDLFLLFTYDLNQTQFNF